MKSNTAYFQQIFTLLLKRSSLFTHRSVYVEVLANPASGVFMDKRFGKNIVPVLDRYKNKYQYVQPREEVEIHYTLTSSREELPEVFDGLILRMEEKKASVRILVTAGGDGFHKDAGSLLVSRYSSLAGDLILLRLPLGTGNDTPEVPDFESALEMLFEKENVVTSPYLVFSPRKMPSDYAFNVISFGIDAYVCQLLEMWKRKIKGDIYKVMVDISTLLYDFKFKTELMRVMVNDRKKGPVEYSDRHVLTVMGAQGKTTYGGGKKILPGKENFLTTHILSIREKLRLKSLFMTGGHIGLPGVSLYETDRVIIDYPGSILAELDGEVVSLKKDNFPVLLERVPEVLKVLAPGH